MYGQLIPVGGGPPLPLLEQRLVLGRAPDCDLRIAGKTVSGRHCELEMIE
ncbi:MAG: FHA domain-containing protein, partial [Planctomycetaceae bacterium]|nr:FHA domain-containing protein [Planctomycetaceae bacterium]